MRPTRAKARKVAALAIAIVLGLQAWNSVACYHNGITGFLETALFLLAVPLLPAVLALLWWNPLCALGSCLGLAPWLLYAYHVDCVAPYEGGGASMVYVGVFLWGTLTSVLGALVAIPLAAVLGIRLVKPGEEAQSQDA